MGSGLGCILGLEWGSGLAVGLGLGLAPWLPPRLSGEGIGN